jgi:hypothetical protein
MIHQPAFSAARAALLHPLVLLIVGLMSWPEGWDKLHGLVEIARSPGPRSADREVRAVGYYEEIIEGSNSGRPEGWIGFKEAGVIRYLDDDFLQFELKPGFRRTLCGQPFVTNSFGMHDGEVTLEKPEGTFRIAVLGASMDMGWGVRHEDTYANRLQDWLDTIGSGPGSVRPRRFEVLNFAVAAYSPLQRFETLRRTGFAFRPDLVIYSATTLDFRLTEIHLLELLRNRVDLRYDFLKQAVAAAGITPGDLSTDRKGELTHKDRLKAKLQPHYWGLYDRTLAMLAAECRSAGIPLVMVIIPRVGKADAPENRAEPVARLKALAAHHAVTVFDLSDTFDRYDPATLEIAAWDDHPNARGHERLFAALAQAVAADVSLSRLLFRAETSGESGNGTASRAERDGDRGRSGPLGAVHPGIGDAARGTEGGSRLSGSAGPLAAP